ncbi:glycosyltransferase family 4 protein [Ignavigranum ruoffiae]|uniref:Glycosyltransferase involved in cell wall bisynthesis n=1 Tax=Ignavigranum ruoffiae TaxID=89093 RepID=A0A1H9DT42_9LACT|nr:glycosyltransferase family 1 protein [Ignavigranum ruoffiae]SEQ16639.1 Glycosyltransferase involved in cell wall bisynthesis [Ignavigranum ruoffiae]
MRILIATETFYPATDGICTRLAHFVVDFKKRGHEVLVLSPDLGITEYQGVPVKGLDTIKFPFYGTRPWGLPNRQIRQIIEEFNPDIVHAVNPFSLATSAVHYATKLNIPLLTSYHTHMPDYLDYYNMGLLKPVLWEYIRLWHKQADYNITVSKSLLEELEEHGIETQAVLPRGLDLSGRHPKYFDSKLYEELTFHMNHQKLLVYVGRLASEKGLRQLKNIFNHRDDICLAFVGDGPEREELQTYFAGTKTTFLGFKYGEELSRAFATGDAFIFPSVSETFGLVISEAMASGLPVIAAESQPTLEQIKPMETGITFENNNETSLMEALKVLDQPLLLQKFKLAGRRAVEGYTWENASQTLLEYYQRAIDLHDQADQRYQAII